MKDGFSLKYDYEEAFELLTNEEIGQLIMALYAYEEGRDVPEMNNITEMAFLLIRNDLEKEHTKG